MWPSTKTLRRPGIEPGAWVWETQILPLNYRRILSHKMPTRKLKFYIIAFSLAIKINFELFDTIKALKLSLFRELDERFMDFEEVAEVFRWHTTGSSVYTNLKLSVPVEVPGSVVSFSFDTKAGDIAFGITFVSEEDGEEESVVDLTRVRSDLETIAGSFEVPREGVVNILWDNSFSWLTAKDLAYNVELQQEAAVISADSARVTAAKDLLKKINEDNIKCKQRCEQEKTNIQTLSTEIPILEKQIEQLQLALKQKKNDLSDSKVYVENAIDRIIVNDETKPGLCIRYLNRDCLARTLSFLQDEPTVGLVCKYWRATILKDVDINPDDFHNCKYYGHLPAGIHRAVSRKPNHHVFLSTSADNINSSIPIQSESIQNSNMNTATATATGNENNDKDIGYSTSTPNPDDLIRSKLEVNDMKRTVSSKHTNDFINNSIIEESSSHSGDGSSSSKDGQPLRWRQQRALLRKNQV
eukprot:gene1091-2122_t